MFIFIVVSRRQIAECRWRPQTTWYDKKSRVFYRILRSVSCWWQNIQV